MKTKTWSEKATCGSGLLYAMLLIVAILVIIFSALGVATLTGLIPAAQPDAVQQPEPRPKTQPQSVQPPAKPARAAPNRIAATACNNCGVGNAINAVENGQVVSLG